MRCLCCNTALKDHEDARVGSATGQRIQMCDHCFGTVADDVADIDDLGLGFIPQEEDEAAGWKEAQDYASGL